ncbi:Mu transposase domain-containing protein [Rhodococcus opacus]|uniref:Mu transposase domain-containing protein n=1 Tax=Rhodococcus opacus TaxID=37919 RepID=UPI00358FBD5D
MQVKVHRDFHAEVAKALYSIPGQWIGSTLEVRADSALVKFYLRGTLVKVHPQPAGGDAPTRRIRPPRRSDMRFLTGTGSLSPAPGTSAPRDLRTERQQPRRWDRGPRELGICRCWSIACRSSSRYSTRRAPANAKMSRRVVDSE